MSTTHANSGANAPAGRKKPQSLGAALMKMQWDSVLAIVMASDPYYHYDATRGAKEASEDKREHWFRRYVMSSSKTRLALHASTVGYLAYIMTHPSQYVQCNVVVATRDGISATECFLYQGAEGMQLLMHSRMPSWAVLLHAVAGSLLLPLALTQKESVFYMQFAKKTVVQTSSPSAADEARVEEVRSGDAQAHSEAKKVHLRRARVSRRHHGNCGFMTGASIAMMVAGGVSLRSYSVFSAPAASARAGVLNFASAMFLFAVPWVVLTPATTASGAKGKAVFHAMLGSLLVKAILAVPFERVLGGLWQRAAGVRVSLPPRQWWGSSGAGREEVRLEVTQHVEAELERVYYKSIAATTVIFGIWGVVDIVRFVRLAKKCIVAAEEEKMSMA